MHFLFISLITWYIFYNGWLKFFPILSFYDELITIFSLGFLISNFFLRRLKLLKSHKTIIINIIALFFIAIISLFSKIINESPLTNLVLFIFNISKIYIIILAAYFSRVNVRRFINDLKFVLNFSFYLSIFFILIDLFKYGTNVFVLGPDWTGNIFIGAHQVCSTSLILFLISTINYITKRNQKILFPLFYLTVALFSGQWSVIIFFIPLLFLYLSLLGFINLIRLKWLISIIGLIFIFINVIGYYYSGLISATAKFILKIPQVDFWYKISSNGIYNLSFLLLGVGPGTGGSPVAQKFNTPFYIEYYKNVVDSFSWTSSGIFTQGFSSLNTITSDSGILIYIIITITLIININIIYKIFSENIIHYDILLFTPFYFLI
ncbi:MAG: hypothetical protein CMG62_00110, partial [Candidatus Marinimicrobia bacterium]|nr:hypothetical protein [Candidatus Neomarinimicrobiota bacterium]